MGKYFELEEVFPRIVDVVRRKSVEVGRAVRHEEIARAMLDDDTTRRILVDGQNRNPGPEQLGLEQIASNAIAWFSQRITEGGSEVILWKDSLEREKIDGKWAYRWIGQT